jgi:hypothetical protein
MDIETDCRSDDGVTVGLVDSIIAICRVLARRDLGPPPVREALRDLATDEDLRAVLDAASIPCAVVPVTWTSDDQVRAVLKAAIPPCVPNP